MATFTGDTTKYPTNGHDIGPDVTISNGSTDAAGPYVCTMTVQGLRSLQAPSSSSAAYGLGIRSYSPPTGVGATIAAAGFAAKAALLTAASTTTSLATLGYAERRIAATFNLALLDFNTQLNGNVAVVQPPSGYGRDLSCVTDLDPAMIEVSGNLVLAQALVRRITTPRGRLLDDPNYGYDVTGFLNDDLDPADIARIGSSIDAELLKDPRVVSSTTTVTLTNSVLLVSSVVTPSSATSFPLVVAITALNVTLLQPTTA